MVVSSVVIATSNLLLIQIILRFKNENSPEHGARIQFTRFHPTCSAPGNPHWLRTSPVASNGAIRFTYSLPASG